MPLQQPAPTPPVENGPQTSIPHTEIPHMGTSQAPGPHPSAPHPATPQPQAPQAQATVRVEMPTLPPGITQDAINAAIAQVEQTGTTDGLTPEVLAAACAQLEAQAKAQGVDLNQAQAAPAQGAPQAPPGAPSNYVEAAVLDKKNVMDGFSEQRESLKTAVGEQRDAMQQPYKDALAKAGIGGGGAMTAESMTELASAIKDLDPSTVALINAIGAMNANPSVLNSVVWIEIIRSVRAMIATEARKQLESMMNDSAT